MSKLKENVRITKIVGAILFLLSAQSAVAYRCQYIPTEVAFASATVVALAEAVKVTQTEKDIFERDGQLVDLRVHATWKGPHSGMLQVKAGGMRGISFKQGEQYLLYATERRGQLESLLCSRTQEYSRAEDELAKLGPPKWKATRSLEIAPRESSGLAISIAPVMSTFSIFDDVAFDLTFSNKSKKTILLPTRAAPSNELITLVVRKNGEWRRTLTSTELEAYANEMPSLKPGETHVLRLTQRGNQLGEFHEYSVQAAVHYSTSTKGLWTGYVFSEQAKFTTVERKAGE